MCGYDGTVSTKLLVGAALSKTRPNEWTLDGMNVDGGG